VRRLGARRVVELGAGSAGFSEALARLVRQSGVPIEIAVSDLRPQPARYRALEAEFPGVIRARTEPFDFVQHASALDDAVVVMSAAFHHVPPNERGRVIGALGAARYRIIAESVTQNLPSMM